MIKLSSCPVFTVLLLVGVLFFLTSKIALDNHTISETNTVSSLSQSSPRDRFWYLDRRNPGSHSLFATVSKILGASMAKTETKPHSCSMHFLTKCTLSKNLIRYWEDETDCFESPLRNSSGLLVGRINDRRYLVFQPDLGGWNNIRMGMKIRVLLLCSVIYPTDKPNLLISFHRVLSFILFYIYYHST